MALHRFALARLPAVPWKNGLGRTREIACRPADGGLDGFAWRASVAVVERGAPFSAFDGVERRIALLDGPGIRLRSADGTIDHRLDAPLAPLAFDGGLALECEPLGDAPSSLFNVMTRRGECDAEVRALRGAATLAAGARGGVLLAVAGEWEVGFDAETPQHLGGADGEGLWWSGEAPRGGVRLAPRGAVAALLAVLIR